MTITRELETLVIQDGKTVKKKNEYYEVGACELNTMLEKVAKGEDEVTLRENLIKNSVW